MFVAIATGPSAIAATSPDGITWTQRTLPASASWFSVCYGAGLFVAVAYASSIAAQALPQKPKYIIESLVGFDSPSVSRFTQKSPYQDGDTHIDTLLNERIITIEGSINIPKNLTSIMAARRELTSVINPKSGTFNVLYEYDGGSKKLTATLDGGPVFKNKLATEAFQKFQVTLIGNDPWLYDDPITIVEPALSNTWAQQTLPVSSLWVSVAYGSGLFVAIAASGTIAATSPDGTTWTQRTLPVSDIWQSICYGAGMFVAVAVGPSNNAATSLDGINWVQRTLPSSASWISVTYGFGIFVAIAYGSNAAAISLDGITWTATYLPANANWTSICFGDGLFVAVAGGPSTIAATSPNGTDWVQRTLPSSSNWSSVVYGSNRFVAISNGPSTSAASSFDGVTWTARTLPASADWQSISYGSGIFVAVDYGPSTIAATSPNGTDWVSRTLPSSENWTSVCYGNGVFISTAYNSSIAASFLKVVEINISEDYSVSPILKINGPVINPIILCNDSFIMMNRILLTGESIIIDCSSSIPSVSYKTSAGVMTNDLKNLVLDSTLFQLQRGANRIAFLADSATITYSERYSGV
jgi:hypothetical protein